MKNHLFNVVIIFLLIGITWFGLLSQTFIGEGGYAYFFRRLSEGGTIFRFNLGASILFSILVSLFADNFFLYQSFELISFVFIGVLFYFFVYELTLRYDVALIAATLFGVNFTTSFEMIGSGYYGNFIERVFFLIPLLTSFALYFMFKNTKKKLYYVLSLIFCGLAIFLAYFNMFFLVFFLAYFFAFFLVNCIKIKRLTYELALIIPFIGLSLYIVYLPNLLGIGGFLSGTGFFDYVFSHADLVLFNSLRQLVFLTVPEGLLTYSFGSTGPISQQSMQSLFFPVTLLYSCVAIYLLKKEEKLRIPLLASLIFLPIAFVLNMYMRGDNVDHLGAGSRYLFAPSLGFAIFWAISLATLIKKFNKNFLYIALVCWLIIQTASIRGAMNKDKYYYQETKKIITYLKEVTPNLAEDSIVIVPGIMGTWGANYLNIFYGKNRLFLPFYPQIEWMKEYGRLFNPQKDLILAYDENEGRVVDLTKDYKKIIISH